MQAESGCGTDAAARASGQSAADDAALMAQALEEAKAALDEGGYARALHSCGARMTRCTGEVPIGCVITRRGQVVARGRNATNARCDSAGGRRKICDARPQFERNEACGGGGNQSLGGVSRWATDDWWWDCGGDSDCDPGGCMNKCKPRVDSVVFRLNWFEAERLTCCELHVTVSRPRVARPPRTTQCWL